jgi:DNA repair protein RecO (recombination protein O)
MKPKTYKTEAIVLKKSRLREADSIVTLYTPHFGKIRAVAKGALRPKSKLRGHIEPLVHSQMQLAHGQNMDTVTQSETLESFLPLRNDLLATSYAIYVAELTDRFSPDGEANYPLFKLLRDTLRRLCQAHNDRSLLLHFELHLLGHLGYRPELHKCVSCSSLVTPTTNFFCIAEGGVICPGCRERGYALRPLSVNALKALRFLQDNDYDTTQRLRITSELSLALQPLVHGYINYLLDREVKSMSWVDRLRAT